MPGVMSEFAALSILASQPNVVSVCESVLFAAEGFKELKVSLNAFVVEYLVKLELSTNPDEIAAILMSFGEIICVYGSEIPVEDFAEGFRRILTIPSEVYGHQGCLDRQLQMPFFFCLGSFIESLGTCFNPFIEPFFACLQPFFDSSSSLMRANSVLAIAKMCAACNLTNELFTIAVNHSIKELALSTKDESRRVIAEALKILVLLSSEPFANRLEVLGSFATAVLESCEYWALWAALALKFEWTTQAHVLGEVLSLLPPPRDSRDLAFCVTFVLHVFDRHPELVTDLLPRVAVALLSSSPKHISPGVVPVLAAQLAELPDDTVVALCGGNEHAICRLRKNLAAA
jgi:hypothetical protein